MKGVRRFMHRLLAAIKRGNREDLTAELENHRELLTDDYVRAGMTPAEASRVPAIAALEN